MIFYWITFLEGVISFVSPCMLPMLPVYVSYFAAGDTDKKKTFANALAFVCGFSFVFCVLGVFAGTLGLLLSQYKTAVNILTGAVVVIFGLNYLDVIHFSLFNSAKKSVEIKGVVSAFAFGIIFSISLSPCVGAFLGSALMLASASGTVSRGVLLLLSYSLGLSIPFLLSAMLINEFSSFFGKIKKHYRIINKACGIFLIVVGLLMCFGMLDYLFVLFS